jgi:hypothetical protein
VLLLDLDARHVLSVRSFVLAASLFLCLTAGISEASGQADASPGDGRFSEAALRGDFKFLYDTLQATHFELTLNMKAAKTLGIKIPQSILVRADRMIE